MTRQNSAGLCKPPKKEDRSDERLRDTIKKRWKENMKSGVSEQRQAKETRTKLQTPYPVKSYPFYPKKKPLLPIFSFGKSFRIYKKKGKISHIIQCLAIQFFLRSHLDTFIRFS